VFRQAGDDLHRYVNLVEANFARFWFRSDRERSRVEEVLSTIPGGATLTEELLQKYHLSMPDNRFGDLVFYLDVPRMFSPTIWGFGNSLTSMHGYLPEYADSDGVLVTNRAMRDGDQARLVDIMPSIISRFDLSLPDYLDGRSLWS
jgi:hypothetical protein